MKLVSVFIGQYPLIRLVVEFPRQDRKYFGNDQDSGRGMFCTKNIHNLSKLLADLNQIKRKPLCLGKRAY